MKNTIKNMAHKTPLHYSYHPNSYSVQARELCDRAINNVNNGTWCIEQAYRFFALSYRCNVIRYRAMTRFNRYVKAGKVYETEDSVQAWKQFKNEHNIEYVESLVGHYLEY